MGIIRSMHYYFEKGNYIEVSLEEALAQSSITPILALPPPEQCFDQMDMFILGIYSKILKDLFIGALATFLMGEDKTPVRIKNLDI